MNDNSLIPRAGPVAQREKAIDGEYIPARDRAEKINVQDITQFVKIEFSITLQHPSPSSNYLMHCYHDGEKTPKGYFAEFGVTHRCAVALIDLTESLGIPS